MAVCKLLREFPDFNSSLDDKNSALIHKKYINIGFAANTDQGLMVPVIKDADQKSLKEISLELIRLSEDAEAERSRSMTYKVEHLPYQVLEAFEELDSHQLLIPLKWLFLVWPGLK